MDSNPDKQITYLALGDSYTIGEGVDASERWPDQLVQRLRAGGIDIADPVIIARTGWTTADLLNAIGTRPDGEEYDLVSLLIGVNNQYQGLSLEDYRPQFQQLLDIAIAAAADRPERVIVLSIPDWSYTPFFARVNRPNTSTEIDAFNAANQDLSLAAGVHYFDITPLTRLPSLDAEWFAADGLHPSPKMYAQWVDAVFPSVIDLLD